MPWQSSHCEIKKVPVTWIICRGQVRKGFSEESLRELGHSIRTKGQLHPIGTLKDGTLLWGERRLRAALLVGIDELEARVYEQPPSETELILIQVAENKHENLSPYELSLACEQMARLNPTSTTAQIAEAFNTDPTYLSKGRKIMQAPAEVVEAFRNQEIGIGLGYSIARADDPVAALAAFRSGTKREQLETSRQRRTGDTVRTERARLALPGGKVVTITGENLSLADVAEVLGQVLERVKKCMKDNLDIRTVVKVLSDQAKGTTA